MSGVLWHLPGLKTSEARRILHHPDHPGFLDVATALLSAAVSASQVAAYCDPRVLFLHYHRFRARLPKGLRRKWDIHAEVMTSPGLRPAVTVEDTRAPAIVDLGNRLKEMRIEMKLTQAEVARRWGVSPQRVSEVERGLSNMTISSLFAYARAVGGCAHILLKPAAGAGRTPEPA